MNEQPTSSEAADDLDDLTRRTIGAAIEVHRHIGPGFFERVYNEALCSELTTREIAFERQVELPVIYKGECVGKGRADLIVEERLIVELKTVSEILPVHRAQTGSYLKAADLRLGLLLNFNVALLKHGIRRIVNPDG